MGGFMERMDDTLTKKYFLQMVPKPVTGGGLQPNYRIDRITRSCKKAADFGCFLFRFFV